MIEHRVEIIAEAGVNHNGSLDMALRLIDAAADAGADVVKFQTFKAEKLASATARKADYQIRTSGREESQLDMLRRLELGEEAHNDLLRRCAERGIEFLSTPFDLDSLDLLVDRLGMERIKLGSGELTNAPLLLATARKGVEIMLSTGMSTLADVEQALGALAFGLAPTNKPPHPQAFAAAFADEALRAKLAGRVTLLHCTTEYPTPVQDVNLRAIETMRSAFELPVGYSDHTVGISIAIAAVARGATVLEKHFTLDRTLPGPDHAASLEPAEFAEMVAGIRQVEQAMGDGIKAPAASERKNIEIARKSLFAAEDIAAGQSFTERNLVVLRPATGRSAFEYWSSLNQKAQRNYRAGEPIDP